MASAPGINVTGALNYGNVASTARVHLGASPQVTVDNATGAVTVNGQVFRAAPAHAAVAPAFSGPYAGALDVPVLLSRLGGEVTLELVSLSAAASAPAAFACAAGALPEGFRPAAPVARPVVATSGGVAVVGVLGVSVEGAITVCAGTAGGAFAGTGVAGWPCGLAVTYAAA